MKKKTNKRRRFEKPKNGATMYGAELRKIAREVGRIIEGFQAKAIPKITSITRMQGALDDYARLLKPWALLKGEEVANLAARQDRKAWEAAAAEMSVGVRQAIRRAPVGRAFRETMARQVELITSLPTEAGKRVHKLVIEGMENSQRATEVAKEIARSGEVTEARAMVIARTETTRAATAFTQARAASIGSQGYIWRTARDPDVRESHRKMEGKYVPWDQPPTLDGLTGHAGALPNCRCYPEPVIPDELR